MHNSDHTSVQPTPGVWLDWPIEASRFGAYTFGALHVRHDSPCRIRLRAASTPAHLGNSHGSIHGGAILTLIDMGIFATARALLEARADGAVTLDLHNQFIGAGCLGDALDVVSEVVRETGRMIFLRGTVEQGDHLVSSFLATLRKSPRL